MYYYSKAEFERAVRASVSEERSKAYRQEMDELRRTFDERQQMLLAKAAREYEEERERLRGEYGWSADEFDGEWHDEWGRENDTLGYGSLEDGYEERCADFFTRRLILDIGVPSGTDATILDVLELRVDKVIKEWLRDYERAGMETTLVAIVEAPRYD
jgi:hypothetical protein